MDSDELSRAAAQSARGGQSARATRPQEGRSALGPPRTDRVPTEGLSHMSISSSYQDRVRGYVARGRGASSNDSAYGSEASSSRRPSIASVDGGHPPRTSSIQARRETAGANDAATRRYTAMQQFLERELYGRMERSAAQACRSSLEARPAMMLVVLQRLVAMRTANTAEARLSREAPLAWLIAVISDSDSDTRSRAAAQLALPLADASSGRNYNSNAGRHTRAPVATQNEDDDYDDDDGVLDEDDDDDDDDDNIDG